MSLVTLIKSADTTLRDAVVQVEDWALPKEAVATGKIDADGRAIFTVLKSDIAAVKADAIPVVKMDEKTAATELEKLEAEAKKLAGEGETDVENFIHEVEDEAKKIAAKVEGFFHKAPAAAAPTAPVAPVTPVEGASGPHGGGGPGK